MNNAATAKTLKDFRFGIEIETVGLGVPRVAAAIAAYFGVSDVYEGTYYQVRTIKMTDGRKWKVETDGSLSHNGAEVVSPILTYGDIDMMQDIVRAIRAAGARVDSSCGIHIHVDGAAFLAAPKKLANLCKLVNQQDELMRAAFGTLASRLTWCRPIDSEFIDLLAKKENQTIPAMRRNWYLCAGVSQNSQRYNQSRYRGVNLHALFATIGTIEFRYFNGTLHAGKIKAYLQFVLALAARAYNARSARAAKRKDNSNVKYAFRTFMLRLGLIGPEYKTCRLHLMKDLPGTQNGLAGGGRAAGYNPRAAVATESAATEGGAL